MNTSPQARDDNARLARMLFWVLLSGVAAALILPLTHALAGRQDGDGMLTMLISTRRLTWYFWEQDRFLNFIPALASVFKDPDKNLHAQVFLRAWMAYLAPLAVLVFFTRSTRTLVVSIALANAMLIASMSFYGWFNLYVQHNPFGTSLVLFALAYLLMSNLSVSRLAVAGLLCLLAYATNFALLVFTGPLLFLLMVFRKDERRRLFGFGLLNAGAIVLAFAHSKSMKLGVTQFGLAPSFDALAQTATVVYGLLNTPVFLSLLALSLFCLATLSRTREDKRALMLQLSAPVLSALVMAVAMSITVWVRMNGFNIRYFLTAEIAVATVIAFIVALRLEDSKLGNWRIGAMLVAIYATLVFGPMGGFSDSYKELISEDRRVQSKLIARAAVDTRSSVIVGDFWDVWPVVYETQRLRFDQKQPLPIYGAAQRASMLGRDFRAQASRGDEQHALCFLPTADACMAEVRNSLQIPAGTRIDTGSVETLTIADKPMLNISFRLATSP